MYSHREAERAEGFVCAGVLRSSWWIVDSRNKLFCLENSQTIYHQLFRSSHYLIKQLMKDK